MRLAVWSPSSIYLLLLSIVMGEDRLPVVAAVETVDCDIKTAVFEVCWQRNILLVSPLLAILRIRLEVRSWNSMQLLLVSMVVVSELLPLAMAVEAVECDMRSNLLEPCLKRKMLSVLPLLVILATRLALWSAKSIYLLLVSTDRVEEFRPVASPVNIRECEISIILLAS